MSTLQDELVLLHRQLEQAFRGGTRRRRLALLLSWPVLRSAVQMELALLGRVRVNRPRAPQRHNAWYNHRMLLFWPFVLLLSGLFPYLQRAFDLSGFLVFAVCVFALSLLWAGMEMLFARKLVVVAAQWTEDAQLDAELERMQERAFLGWRWLFFNWRRPGSVQKFERDAPHRYAYLMGLSRRMNETEGAAGASVERDGQDDAWEALKGRLHAVLVEGQAPEASTAALLLLATAPEVHRLSRLPREDAALYQLFAPEEQQIAHARLTQLLKADPVMTIRLDPALFDTLLFLRDRALEQINRLPSDTLGGELFRIFTG